MKFNTIATIVFASFFGNAIASIKYCSGTKGDGKCLEASPDDGHCENVNLSLNDQTHSAYITSGKNCVFWKNADCQGAHTNQLAGDIDDFNHECSVGGRGSGWQKAISSFTCCEGDANSAWCVPNSKKPTCQNP